MKKQILLVTLMSMILASGVFGYNKAIFDDNDKNPVKTVNSVDLKKYAGKWFEIARYPNRFQKKCTGNVTATYTLKSEKKVEVLNECLDKKGKITKAKGEAKIVDSTTNAKLKVRFAPGWLSWLPFVWGDYWILELDDDYEYVVVGDPGRDYLWILSRESKLDSATYDRLLQKVEEMGFEPKRLVKTPQN